MASKKKDFNIMEQGAAFISHEPQEDVEEPAIKTQRRRVNPGKMWRVNLLLDAELQEPVTIQALREGKNISLLVNDLLKEYISEHYEK